MPCISTRCECGPSELIDDGRSGFLVPIGNVDVLSEKIMALIEDENLRNELGKNAEIATERLKLETICRKWRELAYSVCGKELKNE